MLQEVRDSLVHEAIQSPNLLADLAGLETYIAESYDARSFIELLQNADDAGASRFHAEHFGSFLIVANDGKCFTKSDFESLCRSSASGKSRGDTIGYRGIGFKSVVGVASRVHLLSDTLATTFCRKKTSVEISGAAKVPLIRIPHPLDLGEAAQLEPKLNKLKKSGYQTIFVFEDLVPHAVATEFESFAGATLLFLRNIRECNLTGIKPLNVVAETGKRNDGCRDVRIKENDSESQWTVYERSGVSIACQVKNNVAIALPADDSVVHAFLPTHEKSGIAAKINGDFSTDPSRTKIVLDERSQACTEIVADFLLELLKDCLDSNDVDAISPLVPVADVRMAEFERPSFKKSLFGKLAEKGKGRFSRFVLRPKWFGSFQDFARVAEASGLNVLAPEFEKVNGLSGLLRALGATEARLNQLGEGILSEELSANAAVEVAARVAELESTKQLDVDFEEWKIWSKDGKQVSTKQLKDDAAPIENTTLLAEKLGGEKVLANFLSRTLGEEKAAAVLPKEESVSDVTPSPSESPDFLSSRLSGTGLAERIEDSEQFAIDSANSVAKWRSVEIQVMQYLQAQGWKATDVSRRNVGYDLEATSPEGETFYFETKSLSRIGELFSLSTNEEVVARQYGKNYILALVHATTRHFEIELIPDPANHLSFVRQCKQWTWVCENYPFNPHRVVYEKE